MDLQPNKIDGIIKPITNKRISASEWNQLVGSCMAFITAAGFTPDANDNQQFLNAFIQIAQDIGAVGANVDLSNLSATGENHFVQLKSGVSQADADYIVETYVSGTSWYRVYKSGWCEQGGHIIVENGGQTQSVIFLKTFANDNYALTFAPFASGANIAEANFRCSASSASGCTFYNNSATGVTYRWVACGYLA